jgi:predicted TIM-barrel fold metal-dependent hydrolase
VQWHLARPKSAPASSFADLASAPRSARAGGHIRAGGDRFRGIRHITAYDADASIRNPAYSPPAGLLGDKRFREGFAVLGRLGLSFDAWLYHPQIDELTDLARAFPGTRIVLDHVGGPIGIGAYRGKHQEILPGWKASIRAGRVP